MGRLAEEKGILKLISKFPETEVLTIVGDGPLKNVVARECAKRLNLVFLGHLTHPDVLHAMQKARGFVLPSLWAEGIPTVAIEALACGTPILVSTHCRTANNLVDGGSSGAVYDPEDSRSLSDGMSRIEHDWDSFASAALSHHRSTYGPTGWLKTIQSVYDDVVAQNVK